MKQPFTYSKKFIFFLRQEKRNFLLSALALLGLSHSADAQTLKVNSFAACPKQGYIKASTYISPTVSSGDVDANAQVVDASGNAYLLYGSYGAMLTKVRPDGTIAWKRSAVPDISDDYYGDYSDNESQPVIEGGYIYIETFTRNLNMVPGITGPYTSGAGTAIQKIDLATGTTVKAYGITTRDQEQYYWEPARYTVSNGEVYFMFSTDDAALPVTDGSSIGEEGVYICKLNAAGRVVYGGYRTGRVYVSIGARLSVVNGSLYCAYDGNTSGSTAVKWEKLNPSTGKVLYTYADNGYGRTFDSQRGDIYMLSGSVPFLLTKVDSNGTTVYTRSYVMPDRNSMYVNELHFRNGHVYVPYFGDASIGKNYLHIVSINAATGAQEWTSAITQQPARDIDGLATDASGNVWVCLTADVAPAGTGAAVVSGGGVTAAGGFDYFLCGFNSTGDIIYSTYLGGKNAESSGFQNADNISVYNNSIYLFGNTFSDDFPVTDTSKYNGASWTVFNFDHDFSAVNNDTISPANITVCKLGAGQQLTGNKATTFEDGNVPVLYRNGYAFSQTESFTYQWQQSADSLSWTNITGATAQNYLPRGTAVTMYYRRLLMAGPGCSTPLHTSSAAKVAVNSFTAPALSPAAATNYVTCPGAPLNIGFSITGGKTPFSTSWDNGTGTLTGIVSTGVSPAATATPTRSTVYTATVTDSNGCIQYGQIPVTAYTAGPNIVSSKCGSDSVLLGNVPSTGGATGLSYAWTPIPGLACAACPQTKSSAGSGVYKLTITVSKTGGGTCTTAMYDTVKTVTAPAATVPDGFAGPDLALCSPANQNNNISVPIGRAGSGFTYTWAPGNYLQSNMGSVTTLNLGSVLPVPNPMTYYVTATKSGCTFVDSVKVGVLRADAGIDGCGPRMVGNRVDPTPGITGKTYKWRRLDRAAGNAAFQAGADTNSITTYVTAGSLDTRFSLTVTAGSSICIDTVLVTADCGCINSRIDVLDPIGCPKYMGAAKPIRMKVYIPSYVNDNLTYTWTPAVGLDRYDSSVATLMDGTGRTYSVQIKDRNTGAVLCTVSKQVNGTSWSFPSFTAVDTTTCPPAGTGTKLVHLGQAPVVGYSYAWSGSGLDDTTISNPALKIGASFITQQFIVKVTDNASGCTTWDTAHVNTIPTVANAGPDLVVCGSATATLAGGVDSLTGYRYAWTPPTAWLGGTDSTYLHAKIAVATDVNYVLKATNLQTGCSALDTMHVYTTVPGTVVIETSNASVCKGAALVLKAPMYGGAIYTWTSSNPAETMPASGAGQDSIVVYPAEATTYSLSVNFGGICGSASGSTVISVVDLGYTPVPHVNYCPGAGALTIGPSSAPTTGTPPCYYRWTTYETTRTINVQPEVTTAYALTIEDANGCSILVNEVVNVAQNSKPQAGLARTICMGTTATLGDPSNAGVTWSAVLPATTAMLSSTTAAAPVFTPASVGTFRFAVLRDTGCVNPDSVTITVVNAPVLLPSGVSICSGAGAAAAIGVVPESGLRYNWSPETGLDDPNASQTIVKTSVSTVYTLTATDGNGCQTTAAVPVNVSTTPVPALLVPDLALCIGKAPAQFMTTVTGADASSSGRYTALWTPATNLMSTTVLRPMAIPADTGSYHYTLQVVDQTTACGVSAPANLKVADCDANIINLPVKLLSFNAQPQHRQALLNWEAVADQQAYLFEVQSSVDGSSWQQIGKVPAAAAKDDARVAYTFVDEAPMANLVYYRLKMLELNGTYEYSIVRSVRFGNAQANNNVSWYPNPSAGQITVKTAVTLQQVRVSDLSGRVVFLQSNVTDGTVLNLDQTLGAGMYIISFEWNGQVQADKLMLTK